MGHHDPGFRVELIRIGCGQNVLWRLCKDGATVDEYWRHDESHPQFFGREVHSSAPACRSESLRASPAFWRHSPSTRCYVSEVRLFGSRARGDARDDSDIDLAATFYSGEAGHALGTYFALGDQWQKDFANGLKMPVSLEWWPPSDPHWLAITEKEAVIIWTR
jgi:predicted nucleotidyltransferase